jgi:S-(hydroxymethyl)glutathione dehydrogenase/alcohol dehydrogenase
MLTKGGTATVIGMMPPGARVEVPGLDLLSEKKLQGSSLGSNRFRQDTPAYIDLYLEGRLKLDELVSARIGIDDINEGFAALRAGEVARSVVLFD